MNVRQALVCPACGVQNRPTWEFCAKCGDSLEGATLTTTQQEDLAVEPDAPAAEEVSGVPSTVVLSGWRWSSWGRSRFSPGARPAKPSPRPSPTRRCSPSPPCRPIFPRPRPSPRPRAPRSSRRARGSPRPDLEGARDSFADAVATDGTNPAYRTAYGRALWDLGGRQQALSELGIAARLDPQRQLAYARALDVAGSRGTPWSSTRRSWSRNPDATVVHEDLGRLLYRDGNFGGAAAPGARGRGPPPGTRFSARSSPTPSMPPARRPPPEQVYREVLDAAPEAAISRGLLAENLYQRSWRGGAGRASGRPAGFPDAPLLQRQLGSVLERNGKRAEAAEAYRRYAQLAPNAPDARDLTARAAQLEKAGANR